jgi:hypothetical protein
MPDRLGDAPIQQPYKDAMNKLAHVLDNYFNASGKKQTGFCLMVFPFEGHGGRCNYISNARRSDIVVLLKEQLARFEGMPETSGRG